MAISAMDAVMLGGLYGDDELGWLFSDEAEIAAMIRFEAALARVEARLGVIPAEAGVAIGAALDGLALSPETLRDGVTKAGVAVPALVAELRAGVGGDAGGYVHWGATSQDVMDTALILRLREALSIIGARLDAVIGGLAAQAARHSDTVMGARTRSQLATPTTLGLRIASWLAPLDRCRDRLGQLRPRLLVVQLGGASGTLAALGGAGVEVMEALAGELDLGVPAKPWHAERDGLAELAGWLSLVTGTLGRMGGDLILLGRSEIGEVKAGAGGGSSTMPQKSNPVGAEALVALARFNAAQVGLAHQALLHAEERDATAWSLEWMALPQMIVATGAALRHAEGLAGSLEANPERMRANLGAGGGAALAEAASFALARHMALPAAQALVKRAVAKASRTARPLVETLAGMTDVEVDWQALADPSGQVGEAKALIERVTCRAGG